jgi:DNA-binding NtrC family response regulator
MAPTTLLIYHPASGPPPMLDQMLRALGHDRIEAVSYRSARRPPADRPGLVVLGVDPIDAQTQRLFGEALRDDHAPPFILLFTAASPPAIRADVRLRAAAVLRFPLPASQLDAAVIQALAGSRGYPCCAETAPGRESTAASSWREPARTDLAAARPEPRTVSLPTVPEPDHSLPRAVGRAELVPASPKPILPLKRALEEPERALVLEALQAFHWSRNKTADALEICRSALYQKMRRYKLFDLAPRRAADHETDEILTRSTLAMKLPRGSGAPEETALWS